jgi:hypothetical protein
MKTQAKLEKGCKSYFNLIKNGKVYQIICGEHLIGEIGDLCPTCQAQLTQTIEMKKEIMKMIDKFPFLWRDFDNENLNMVNKEQFEKWKKQVEKL